MPPTVVESLSVIWNTHGMKECLQSDRLILRRLRAEDADDIVRLLAADREAIQMMAHMPYPCTGAAAREWIALRTQPGTTAFAITQRADGAFLGAIGFTGLPEMPSVGYWVGRPYWNRGYATEALRLVIEYARGRGVKGLQAETFPENPASGRVLSKCGFRDRGLGLRNYPIRGGLCRVHVHILHFATEDARRKLESA